MLVSLTTADFLRFTSWGVFLLIGFVAVLQAIRRPTPANVDVGLLFGGLAVAIIFSALVRAGVLASNRAISLITGTALVSMPFLLVRLMDDVVGVPPRLMRIFMGLFALYILIIWLVPTEVLTRVAAPLLLGLIAPLAYVVVAGLRAVRRSHGITRRRLIAVSVGSVFLALNFVAGRLPLSPEDARSLVDIFGVAAGVSYYLGFAPPRWLRRVWQSAELRAYLGRSTSLVQLADRAALIEALEQGAAAALGAPYASIGLWDEGAQALQFTIDGSPLALPLSREMPATRAFQLQRPIFSGDTRYSPDAEERYGPRALARVVLAAPITAGDQRLGVLAVYAHRVSVFAEDDIALLQILAEHTAVVLESRRLGQQFAELHARESAARLKDDFLSSAAHDLKTPLTTLILQAQLLERRAKRNPEAPADPASLRLLVSESEHLRAMILELLEAARSEQGRLLARREAVDLAALLRAVAQRHGGKRHAITVEAPEQLSGFYDPGRLQQLLDNLVENAVKYSPQGQPIMLRLWQDDAGAHITVADQGIGIPAADLPYVFERFHRGANVDDRRFPGWGLGLVICRRIVEQHGGQIAVSSQDGAGSTFHVILPLAPVPNESPIDTMYPQ